jgi:hypothetical protein
MLDGFIVIDCGLRVLFVLLDESTPEEAAEVQGIISIATPSIASTAVHMAIINHNRG